MFHEFLSDVLPGVGFLVFELKYKNLTEYIKTLYISRFLGSRW